MRRAPQIALALFPLVLTPIVGYLLAEGVIDPGGGEKDILWAFVYCFWSLLFSVSAIVMILRRKSLYAWLRGASLFSLGSMVLIWGLAFIGSMLGMI